MKMRFNILLCLSLLVLAACDNDEEKDSGQVTLLSFGPAGVRHGEEIVFIGTNLNKVTSIELVSASVPQSSFVEQTREKIRITVPPEAEAGPVVLKTAEGDIVSKTVLSFEVPVVIESVTAEARPGATITFTGQFLNWVESVTFADDLVVTEFESQTLTELVVEVPWEAKSGALVITTGGTEPLVIETEEDLVVTLPDVTALNPASIRHTENLTLEGTDLDLVQKIRFGGGTEVSDFVSQTETALVVTVPNTAEAGPLTLVAPSLVEVETTQALTIILPVATALSPVPAPAGADVTITGTNLDLVYGILFPNVEEPVTTFISQSATEIVVTSPAETMNGAIRFETIHGYVTEAGVSFVLPGEDLTPLSYTIFDDQLRDNWQNWSWGGEVVVGTNEQVRFGTTAIKKTFDGSWDGLQLGNGSKAMDGYTHFSISVFGGPGTEGKQANIVLNEMWGVPAVITLYEGVWTEYDVTWAEAGGPTSPIYRIALQARGWAGTVYVDKIGFK